MLESLKKPLFFLFKKTAAFFQLRKEEDDVG